MTPSEPPRPPDRSALRRLLAERNQNPEHAPRLDAQLRQTFERRVAILALDMCGFSRLTAEHGIIHYLAMIHQMEECARPAVTGNGGRVIKQEADNLFTVFDHPRDAVEAALDVFRAFEAVNAAVPPERHLRGSIGIGYGETLVIGDEDLFGHEMNVACKLGEDLAGPAEILLSPAAHAALPPGHYECVPASFPLGGRDLTCYRFIRPIYPRPDQGDD